MLARLLNEQIVTIAKTQLGDKNGQKFWSWYAFNCRNPNFFDWEGDGESNHVGIVERYEGGIVYTVEENSDDAVRERCYPILLILALLWDIKLTGATKSQTERNKLLIG